jgi:AcrR family transcriptional regulator
MEARQLAEQTQRRLIAECACRLIADGGLEAATMRAIAADLGCTTGLITHYFPAKEELLLAALRVALREVAAGYDPDSAPRTLDDWVDQMIESFPTDEPKRVFWCVFGALQAASLANERLAEAVRHFADRNKPTLEALVTQALPDDQAERAAELTDVLWLIADGIGVSAALHGQQLTPERVRQAMRGLWRGLLETPAADGEAKR